MAAPSFNGNGVESDSVIPYHIAAIHSLSTDISASSTRDKDGNTDRGKIGEETDTKDIQSVSMFSTLHTIFHDNGHDIVTTSFL
jgi:hypothetical protein